MKYIESKSSNNTSIFKLTNRQPDKYLTNFLENRNRKEAQPDSIVQANIYSSPTSQNQFVANLFQPLEFGYNKKEQVFILKNL